MLRQGYGNAGLKNTTQGFLRGIFVISDSVQSEPDTFTPLDSSICARALMLIPKPSITSVSALVTLPALLKAVISVPTAVTVDVILFATKTVANNAPIVFKIVIIVEEFDSLDEFQ